MKNPSPHLPRPVWLCCLFLVIFARNATPQPPDKLNFSNITKPDFFPILPWDPYHGWNKPFIERTNNGLESIAECHFNLAGFVLPKDLPRCRKLGLGAIMGASGPNFTNSHFFRQWRNLSDDEIDRRVKQVVAASGSSPAVMGYFIMDEPGVTDFPALAKAVAAVKKYAPGKLAYINLFPDYATLG